MLTFMCALSLSLLTTPVTAPHSWAQSAAVPARNAPSHTPSGGTYTLPAEWSAHGDGAMTVLTPPESDLHLALVEGIKASDGKQAAAAAWQTYRPGGAHPFNLATARAPGNGWDEQSVIDYETSPGERLAIQALARRKGDSWTVLIIEGSEATGEKRLSAIAQIASSLRPAGYQRESFAGRQAHPLDPARVAQMVDFVRKGAAQLRVPGVGFALYDHGRIVYEGGVGVKELGKPDPVDAHTDFMIASNTKSMSTLLLAELVSEGKLHWDDPVTTIYPAFRLGDDATTRSVQIRHLVCACTGLPRKDMEWLFADPAHTPASNTFALLAATQPTSKFGEVFQYNNVMAAAAGYIAGHVFYPDMELGAAYDRAIREHVTTPLAMHDTTMSLDEALKRDHASPHGEDADGKAQIIRVDDERLATPLRPAGAAWSSPHDMILYMRNEMDQGLLPNGKRLLSSEALLARRTRGVPVGEDKWYGMGLMEDATWGVSVIHHGGDIFGFHSDMYAIPQAGVAAVILTNGDNGYYLLAPFMRRLLELLYDGRSQAEGDVAANAKRVDAETAQTRSRLIIPGDPAVLAGLASAYTSPELGTIRIERGSAGARVFTPGWNSAIVTRRNDDGTISLIISEPAMLGTEWVIGTNADRRTLTIRDGQHAYVFAEGEAAVR